jgi:hypothetical protein
VCEPLTYLLRSTLERCPNDNNAHVKLVGGEPPCPERLSLRLCFKAADLAELSNIIPSSNDKEVIVAATLF